MQYTDCVNLHPGLYACTRLAATGQVTERGLVELSQSSDTCSEQILTYTCVTAGRGATEVTLDNITIQDLEFSHSLYADGSNVPDRSSPDGAVTAGNLSRSQAEDCLDELDNSTSYCFMTVIKVRLTDQTRCRTIGCRTRFRIDGVDRLVDYGNATVTRGK